jgi:transporter family protein
MGTALEESCCAYSPTLTTPTRKRKSDKLNALCRIARNDGSFDIEIVYPRSSEYVKLSQTRILRGMTWLFWALLSALFAAATALLAKVGVEGIDSNLATAIRTTVVLVFTWGIALGLERHHGLSEIGRRSWVFLVLSGVCTGLSWLCYFRALQIGPASSVAPVDKLSVVLVILGAWLFLGEHLTPAKVIGGSLVTLGAMILAFA